MCSLRNPKAARKTNKASLDLEVVVTQTWVPPAAEADRVYNPTLFIGRSNQDQSYKGNSGANRQAVSSDDTEGEENGSTMAPEDQQQQVCVAVMACEWVFNTKNTRFGICENAEPHENRLEQRWPLCKLFVWRPNQPAWNCSPAHFLNVPVSDVAC